MKKAVFLIRLAAVAAFCLPLMAITGCGTAAQGPPAEKRAAAPASASAPASAPTAPVTGAPKAAPVPPAPASVPAKAMAVPAGTVIPRSEMLPKAKEAATPRGQSLFRAVPGNEADLRSKVPACWLPLVQRLQSDNMGDPIIVWYFSGLAEYSSAPMTVKVREMFNNAFVRRPPKGEPTEQDLIPLKARIYKNVVTRANLEKCALFLEENKSAFGAVEKKYAVPREIIAALLYVETRLGGFIGKENAFWSLACMAAADTPERIKDGIAGLPLTEEHESWLRAKLADKSGWAYKELKALLSYCSARNLDPHGMPGSVYGAIGLCQFMPSNLIPYGDDGDGDGAVNLFSEPDAIFSVAKYLTGHGWKGTPTVERQREIIKRYNNLTIYANTILTLAESLRTGVPQLAPPDVTPEELAAVLKSRSAKAGGKAAAKDGTKAGIKPAAKAGAKQPAAKSGTKAAPKPGSKQPGAKPGAKQPEAKPAAKAGAKAVSGAAAKPAVKGSPSKPAVKGTPSKPAAAKPAAKATPSGPAAPVPPAARAVKK